MNLFGILCFVGFFAAVFSGVWWCVVLISRQLRYWKYRYLDRGSEHEALMRGVWNARFAYLGLWTGGLLIGALGIWLGNWPIDKQ